MSDPFGLSATAIAGLLRADATLFPELEAARADLAALREAPQTKLVLAQTEALMTGLLAIPQTPYSYRRFFNRNGDRGWYEAPYFLKRTRLAAAALRLFLGQAAPYEEQIAREQATYLEQEPKSSSWSPSSRTPRPSASACRWGASGLPRPRPTARWL